MQSNERVPQFTRGDRLRKARSLTGLNTRDFAKEIGVSHGTVTNAEHDKPVRPITIKQWALATGVPAEWLEHGIAPADGGGPSDGAAKTNDEYLPQITGTAHVMPLRRVA